MGFFLWDVDRAFAATLYSTGFDNPPFSTSTYMWAGVDGWDATDPTSGTASVTSDGGAVYLGSVAPADPNQPTAAWRHIGLDPVALGLPIVKITTKLAVYDSTNSKFDLFAFALYNQKGDFLSALLLDNYSLAFGYNDDASEVGLPGKFANGVFFTIAMTINMATNRASAQLIRSDGSVQSLFANRVFNGRGQALNLGEFDYLWVVNSSDEAGDNAMIIDSLSIEAFPNPSLSLAKNGTIKIRRDSYILRGGQSPGDDVQIQWRTKDHKRWSAVRGVPTQWLLKLKKLKRGRNVVQLRMLDILGREIDHRSVVIIRK